MVGSPGNSAKRGRKIEDFPLSENTTPENLANKIISLRSDSSIKEARTQLHEVFLDLKREAPLKDVREELLAKIKMALKEKKKIKFRMLLKSTLTGLVLGGHIGKIQLGLKPPAPLDFSISVLAIPLVTYTLIESLQRDYERLETYCWTGFFEKLM